MVDRQECRRDCELSEQHRRPIRPTPICTTRRGVSSKTIAGKTALHFAHKVEEGVKNLLVPSVIFEELGLRYYGPIDGHDIPLLIRTFEFLKSAGRAGAAAHSDQKRERLRAGDREAGQIPRSRKIQARHRRNRARADADLFGDYRQDAGEICRHESKDRRDHRRDAERNRSRIFPGATSRLVTSMSESPRNMPRFLPAAWRRRA